LMLLPGITVPFFVGQTEGVPLSVADEDVVLAVSETVGVEFVEPSTGVSLVDP
jgi:hypothetical protein